VSDLRAYQVELDVDVWGHVEGGEKRLTTRAADHDWHTPYPALDRPLSLRWRRGTKGKRPNLYWYPPIWHWVCDQRAFDVLTSVVPDDIHVIARAELKDEPVWVVQVVTRLDGIVDRSASLIDQHPTYEVLQWPSFFASAAERMSGRLFCVPEMTLTVFMGEAVRAAFDEAELRGLRYVAVDWTEDRPWTAEPSGDERTVWQRAKDLGFPPPPGVPVGLAHLAALRRFDRSLRADGLLLTVAQLGPDGLTAAAAAATYLELPELAAAITAASGWTKSTVDELETRCRTTTADKAIRTAFARRFAQHPDEF
jgi:hypothetical protein